MDCRSGTVLEELLWGSATDSCMIRYVPQDELTFAAEHAARIAGSEAASAAGSDTVSVMSDGSFGTGTTGLTSDKTTRQSTPGPWGVAERRQLFAVRSFHKPARNLLSSSLSRTHSMQHINERSQDYVVHVGEPASLRPSGRSSKS